MAPNETEHIQKENGSRLREITAVPHKYKISRGVTPEKLRLILEELGPTYVKLGQIMSLHSDILPKRYCDELMKLNTEVTPMPFEVVEEVLDHSYRGHWDEIFASMDPDPIGSASIAQVHRATLKNGEEVIVKVERKGIYDTMARDIRLLHRAVRLLPPVANLKNLVDLNMVLDEMWTVAQEEMDFLKEAANMEEFAANNADVTYIKVPRLYREYTTSHVLVMEYIDAPAINETETLTRQGYDLDEIGRKFVNNFIKQVMEDGFFHADPHPGNVKIEDGKIVWLDMGMMGRLTERDRGIMVRGVEGIAMHDVSKVTDAVLDLGTFWGKQDRDQLYRDLRDFLQEYGSRSMGSIDLGDTLEALMDIMKKNHIGMPHGMTMLARGLTHMEGVLAEISPEISMMEIAVDRASENWLKSLDWKAELEKNARRLYRSGTKGIELPSLFNDALKEYLKGQGRMNLKLETSQEFSQLVWSSVRNLVIGICITGLLLSSSILCTTDMAPKVLGIPVLGALGYIIAFGAIFYLLARYGLRKLRQWRRR